MNNCLTHEQVLAFVSARRVADVELWSHVTQCGGCHRRIAEMTGVAWLAASLEAFQAGAVDGVPHDAVRRVFDRLRPLYEKEVAPLQNCPDDEALLAFTLGDAAAAEETRRHVQQCGSCQKAVVQLRSLHKFVTDYEAFLSAPDETIPDPVARRIFENVNAVCQTEHSAKAEHPDWAWLLSMLAGTTEPKAEVRSHVAGCTECREFLSRLLGTVRLAGALEAFADDRESEMPLAAAGRIFERIHAEYQQNVAAASRTRAQVPAGTDAEQPLPLDENLAGPAPSEAGQAAGQSGLWRRLLPYASAASLLLALGVHGFKGSLNRVGELASATPRTVHLESAPHVHRRPEKQQAGAPELASLPNRIGMTAPSHRPPRLLTVQQVAGFIRRLQRVVPRLGREAEVTAIQRQIEKFMEACLTIERGRNNKGNASASAILGYAGVNRYLDKALELLEEAVFLPREDKVRIEMSVRLEAAAIFAETPNPTRDETQAIEEQLTAVGKLGPIPVEWQSLYDAIRTTVDRSHRHERTDLNLAAKQNEEQIRKQLQVMAAFITGVLARRDVEADFPLETESPFLGTSPGKEHSREHLRPLFEAIAILLNPTKWPELLKRGNAEPNHSDGQNQKTG